jgi:aryl-alcohol dehydrogenase-like predicted oxidoreductase
MGVSLYSPEYAEKALLLDSVDIIQVPANLFDRRLLRSNWFARAVASGKKVFVRSVFLQGFIFLSEEVAEKETEHGAEAIRRLTRFCLENQVDKKEFALQFVRHMAPGALLLFGAETAAQVSETVQLIRGEMREAALFDRWMKLWPQDYESLINPLNWTRYQTR